MNKYRTAALALTACAATVSVAACSSGTPSASSAATGSTGSASPSKSAAAVVSAPVPTTGAPIAGKTISVSGKLTSFPVPAAAKVVENTSGGKALVVVFGKVTPGDVARFYATALPQAGYSVSTNSMLSKGSDTGAYIVFTGHGYKGTVDSLNQFPGASMAGLGTKDVTTIIFAATS